MRAGALVHGGVVREDGASDVRDAAEARVAVADDGHGARGATDGGPRVRHRGQVREADVGVAQARRGDAVAGHERALEVVRGEEARAQRVVDARHQLAAVLREHVAERGRGGGRRARAPPGGAWNRPCSRPSWREVVVDMVAGGKGAIATPASRTTIRAQSRERSVQRRTDLVFTG